MKTRNIFFYTFVLISVLFSSCIDEDVVERNNGGKGTKLIISVRGEDIVNTRAAGDNLINHVYAMIVDNQSGNLVTFAEAVLSGDGNYYATLGSANTNYKMYIIANASGYLKSEWLNTKPSFEEIKEAVFFDLSNSDGLITKEPPGVPMYSVTPADYTSENGSYTIELTRSVSKVTVQSQTEADNHYELEGANLGNISVGGYLFDILGARTIPIGNYAGEEGSENSVEVMTATAVDGLTEPLYAFKTTKDKEPFVIIKGTHNGTVGYHRINLWDKTTKTYYDINRNYWYKVTVNKVYTAGFSTAAEAIKSNGSNNIDADITVSDGTSQDIISNGEYYLGVSNTECLLYFPEKVSDVEVATVVIGGTNIPTSFELTCTTTETNNPAEQMTVVDNKETVDGVTYHKLNVTMPLAVNKGEITLRAGELLRKIKVRKINERLSIGGSFDLGEGYVYGKMQNFVNLDPEKWIGYANNSNTVVSAAPQEYINTSATKQKLYMVLRHNLVMKENQDLETKTAELVLTKANEEGHTKVIVTQPSYDIFENNTEAYIKNPYVGAFWRADQTGERVIKMDILSQYRNSISQWDAVVVIGNDWAGLSLEKSKDPNLYNNKPALGTDNGFDDTYNVSNPQNYITTTSVANGEVSFRIGLKNTIDTYDHRYGLVIVNLYDNNGDRVNAYRIFLRQGDTSDYVYRSTDQGYDNWGSGIATPRPLAKKLSAFNLTDPKLGKGGSGVLAHNQMELDYLPEATNQKFKRNEFTTFPSAAGYCFIWNIAKNKDTHLTKDNAYYMRAFHPTNFSDIYEIMLWELYDTGDPDASMYKIIPIIYNTEGDPCPYGYRYPSVGKVDPGNATIVNAEVSEIMQSLLYDPLAPTRGDAASIMSDYTLWGYYADGFFDRLSLFDVPNSGNTDKNMAVYGGRENLNNANGNEIGFVGQVVFNPFNLASIFFPAVGRPMPFGYSISQGEAYFLSVSERIETNENKASCNPMDLNAYRSSFAIVKGQGGGNQPRTVRCIKDETILSGGF